MEANLQLPLVKNDSSLLFRKLNELHTVHRIIMTGVSLSLHIIYYAANLSIVDTVK